MGKVMAFDTKPFNEDAFMEKEFLKIKKEHGIKTVIETGTFHGVTTKWLCENFDKVVTVEVNEQFFKVAHKNLEKNKNVEMYFGSSFEILPFELLKTPEKNLLLFLDAHWYANPLLQELTTIAYSKRKPLLAIHDFKVPNKDFVFDSYNGQDYEWSWIEPYIEKIYGKDGFEYYYNEEATGARSGCIFIKPKSK